LNENVDSHLGFKSRVKAPGSVGAVVFLFLKYSLIKGLDGFKTAKSTGLPGMRGAGRFTVPIKVARCTPVIPSVGPRPTTMLFYVRHRADGRKKNQFDLHDDLLFIPLATSFVLALTLDWTLRR
jgi:hypothetical protein